MTPEDKLDDLLARGARALDAVPPMADEVLRRIERVRAAKPPTKLSYRVPFGERMFLMSRVQKIAAAVVLGLLLGATGWAAEKVVESVIEGRPIQVKMQPDTMPMLTTTAGGGSATTMGIAIRGMVESSTEMDDWGFTAAQRAELPKLVAGRKYTLIGKAETPGGTEYRYRFVFSDGVAKEWPFYLPLEGCKSLDDYNQKYAEYEARRQEAIQKALAKGHYRLVNIELRADYECVDVATGKTLFVSQVKRPDGVPMAMAHVAEPGVRLPGGGWRETLYETTWQEHLEAIRAGRRKLVDAMVTKLYFYEMTLDDGSKTIFVSGGDMPLEKLNATSRPAPPAPAAGGK